MEVIPSCTRTTDCTSLFGMPVSHARFSHKLVKWRETGLPASAHSQHTCSWFLYRCQQHWVLRVKVLEKKVNYPSYGRCMGSERCMFDFASLLLREYIDTHSISLWEELNTQGTGCCSVHCSNGTCYSEKIV